MTPVGSSVRARLTMAILALLVAIVAALSTWQVFAARSSQQAQIQDSEVTAAHLASSALGSALASRLLLLSNLAGQPGLAPLFTRARPSEQAKVVLALHELYPGFASFEMISPEGRLEARWPNGAGGVGTNLAAQPFFIGAMASGRPYISQALQQPLPPNELVTLLLAQVRNPAGHIAGLLAASIPGSALGSLIGGTSLRDRGAIEIYDQEGHSLTGPGAGATRSFRSLPAVARALAGGTGSTTGRLPGYSGNRLIGFAPVPAAHWVVLVEQPVALLNDEIDALTDRLVAIGFVVLVLASGAVALVVSLARRLAHERQRTGALVASVGEGVATLGLDGGVQSANPAMGRLVGRPVPELVGKRWDEAFRLYDQRGTEVPWSESLAHRAVQERSVIASSGYGLHIGRADGLRVPVFMTAAPLVAADELLGAVVVLRDVSNEREVDQLKSTLVSTVSHELRTPLTMVQGFAELLLERENLGDERSREALGQIHSASLRLGRLIDDLLSVSRIDSGKLRVDLAAVDLPGVMDDVARVVAAQADAGRLVLQVPRDLPPVLADRDKLVQVITNLVSNALKYSQAPSPVQVVAKRKQDHAEISVVDEGIGLSEAECSQVFEKFVRADHPEVRRVSGTGLGLYITKSLVEMQHGQIWVNSQPGSGSIFAFSLPLAPRPTQAAVFSLQAAKEPQ